MAAFLPEAFRCGFGFSSFGLGIFFLHQRGALAEAFAQVGEFGAADGAFALDFHLVNAGRMDGEHALDAPSP